MYINPIWAVLIRSRPIGSGAPPEYRKGPTKAKWVQYRYDIWWSRRLVRVVPDSDSMIRGCHARVGAIGSCREGALSSTGLGPVHKVCGDAGKQWDT